MRIGDVARRTGCSIETIRYYERQGLLPAPSRSGGNYREYSDAEVGRLSFIRHCRSLDMTLDEIGTLLTFKDNPEKHCAAVNLLLDEHIGHVAERITELNALSKQLVELRRLCRKTQKARDCGILKQLGKGNDREPYSSSPVHNRKRGS